jgi:hypothetical protein
MLKVKILMKASLILLISFLSLSATANLLREEPWFSSKDLMIKNKTYFEIFGGAVYPNMTYSTKSINKIERNPFLSYDAGISVRFQRGKWFSFSPRLTYFGQGVSMKDDLKYRLSAKYFSFSFPFELQFDLNKKMNRSKPKFFFYSAPFIAIPVSAHVKTNDYSKTLTRTDMNTFDWGGEVGLGLRIPTFTLDGSSNINIRLSYLRGFNDTYTKFEKNSISLSQREQLYVNDGKRFNSAIKLTIGIEIPLKAKKFVSFTAGGNGKKNYKRVVVVDEK